MHIIGDTPFKCNMGTTPRAELSEEDMLHLLQSQGGDLARAYAAPNHMEASLHFMHMLSEGTAHQVSIILQWRHNEPNGVSIHRRLGCLLNCLFRRR